MSMEYGRYGLKSFSWGIADVFAADGSGHILTCCEDHFPLTYTDQNTNERHIIEADSEQVSPIFADYELDFYPSCDLCGKVWEYTNLTEEGISYELEQIDNRIAGTASPSTTQELYEQRDEFVERYGIEE